MNIRYFVAPLIWVGCLTASGFAQPPATKPDLAATPASLAASALVTGRVLDAAALVGLPGVEVRTLAGTGATVTDSAGEFHIAITTRGLAILMLRKLGYAQVGVSLDVRPGDSLRIATTMKQVARTLDTLRVVRRSDGTAPPRVAGFERRRGLNAGTFITPDQLERTPSVSIGDVLRGISSITVTADQFGILAIESTRGSRLDRRAVPVPCRVRVLVDGFLIPFGTPLPITSPKQVYGIEVYAGPATIPRELAPNGEDAFCGLVAIWSK